MKMKAFNAQAFLEFLCYSVFAALIIDLANSGKYLNYVTPRMKPYLYFTAAVMLVWVCLGLRRLFRPQHKIRSAHCFVLAIPILLLLLPHSPISASDLSSGYSGGSVLSGLSDKNPYSLTGAAPKTQAPSDSRPESGPSDDQPADSAGPDTSKEVPVAEGSPESGRTSDSPDTTASDSQEEGTPDASDNTQGDDSILKEYGLKTENGMITVGDEEFYPWLAEIYTNMDKYEGYKIKVKGFVFKDAETMKANEFVPARLLMSCCVADLVPCGIICEYDKASELKEDTWVTVEGVIHVSEYEGQPEPQIAVTKISLAEKPEQEYIYP